MNSSIAIEVIGLSILMLSVMAFVGGSLLHYIYGYSLPAERALL